MLFGPLFPLCMAQKVAVGDLSESDIEPRFNYIRKNQVSSLSIA
jgi:hypothetical protein